MSEISIDYNDEANYFDDSTDIFENEVAYITHTYIHTYIYIHNMVTGLFEVSGVASNSASIQRS